MKKQLLTLAIGVLAIGTLSAQTMIYDNGPILDLPGAGAAGADVSSLHDGMGTYGAGHAVSSGFRVADDIVVPANEIWTIDSLAFFAYQTGSGNISTINEVNVQIWDGPPGAPSSVIFGDETTNLMITTDWTGVYRTGDFGSATCDPATCVDRPIMRNVTQIGFSLPPGTYWVDWQVGGTGASGPWAPPINLGAGITTTGNSKQYNPTTLAWTDLTDGALTTEFQGMPFQVIGSIMPTSIEEVGDNFSVSVYPNPVVDIANVSLGFPVSREDNVSFTMYDVLGKVVNQINGITSQKFSFNRNNLKNGVYFYEVSVGNKAVKNGKIVLQ